MAKKKTASRSTGTRKKTSRTASKSASKKTTRKTTKKTTGRSAAARKKTTGKKTTGKKVASKKTTRKSTPKKTTAKKKATAKKSASKKKTTKKTAARSVSKKTTKKATTKKTTKKSPAKSSTPKKKTTKKTTKKTAAKTTKTGGKRKLGARSVAEAASAGAADASGYVFVNGRRVRMISTGGQGIPKPSKRTERAADVEVETVRKPVKTTMTTKELKHYRQLLLAKRAELVGDLQAMESAAFESGGDDISKLPVHMADVGSDTYAQDLNIGLAEKDRSQLREIDEALLRIRDKTYGMCLETGERIPDARLEVRPWAKYSIEAKRKFERQSGM